MATAVGAAYRPRDAAGSALYRAVLDHLETYLAARSRAKSDPSHPVAEESLRRFLQCGIPRFGVARFRCKDCGDSRFVPFSCKRRTACPSCDAKRAVVESARIINYADDFVVVARTGAAEVLAQVRRWLVVMKLELNETKTCIRDGRKEHFCFLGYELGPMMNRRIRRRYLGARPSKKAMGHIRKTVSETLWRGRNERWEVIRDELNRKLQGWANCFAYGSPYASFRLVDIHVAQRVRNLLRRRHKLPRATGRFGYDEVHRVLGVIDLHRLLRTHAHA